MLIIIMIGPINIISRNNRFFIYLFQIILIPYSKTFPFQTHVFIWCCCCKFTIYIIYKQLHKSPILITASDQYPNSTCACQRHSNLIISPAAVQIWFLRNKIEHQLELECNRFAVEPLTVTCTNRYLKAQYRKPCRLRLQKPVLKQVLSLSWSCNILVTCQTAG